MNKDHLISYIRLAFALLSQKHDFAVPGAYFKKFTKLILNANMSSQNLAIALFLLHKFNLNTIVRSESNTFLYTIVMSLILSNKLFNDQSYTLKTWNNLLKNAGFKNINLELLKSLEVFFCTTLDYKLSFQYLYKDDQFWNKLAACQIDAETVKYLKGLFTDDETTIIYAPKPIAPVVSNHDMENVVMVSMPMHYLQTPCASYFTPSFTPFTPNTPNDSPIQPIKRRKLEYASYVPPQQYQPLAHNYAGTFIPMHLPLTVVDNFYD